MAQSGGAGTGFSRLGPRQARLVLVGLALVVALLVAVTLSPLRSGYADAPDRGPGDIALYNAEVRRIQSGESYYQAAAAELRSRGYPTRSVFNWRMPLPMWLVGSLPSVAMGKALLGGLCLALLLAAFELVAREAGTRAAIVCGLCLTGALLPCILGDLFVAPELWSGVLIGLSACALGLNRPSWGVALGVAALFFRELAAPYCGLCWLLAAHRRRRGEAWGWTAGIVAYGLFFTAHALVVRGMLGPSELAHESGWVRFGGAAFVLSTSQMNAYLLLLPQWVTAVYFSLAMLGFAGWNSAAGQRIGMTAALYVALFAIVGQPFNQYWGSMFAPLLCLSAGMAPGALADLRRAAALAPAAGLSKTPG